MNYFNDNENINYKIILVHEPDYTDIILNKYNVKATFFVMGKWIIYPEGNKEKLIKI